MTKVIVPQPRGPGSEHLGEWGMGAGGRSGATVLVHTCTLSCNRTERGDAANPDLNFETEHGDAT